MSSKTIAVSVVLELLDPLTEHASQALATAYAAGSPFNESDELAHSLLEMNLAAWRLKWELGDGPPLDSERLRAQGFGPKDSELEPLDPTDPQRCNLPRGEP